MKSEIKNKIKRYFLVRNQRKLLADELQRNLVRIQKEKKKYQEKKNYPESVLLIFYLRCSPSQEQSTSHALS